MSPAPIRCDIFCMVIDNFGDVGVCWRLARQLATEFGWQVRLLVDDASALAWLAPDRPRTTIEVDNFDNSPYRDAEVVIEAFACEIPQSYQAGMVKRSTPAVWINLEYLSAEKWVGESHGLASVHPQLSLTKYFFFPGFDASSGGLIREHDYDQRRSQFDIGKFCSRHNLPIAAPGELTVSLFAYPHTPLAELYAAWSASPVAVLAIVPGSTAPSWTSGNLRVLSIPYLSQFDYDQLLWLCDLNFVRGEDSFVRAQWAGKPMVWQIYPQTEDTHLSKLDSFLTHYQSVRADKLCMPWTPLRGVATTASETTALQGGRAQDALMKPLRSKAVKQDTLSSPLRICAVADDNTALRTFWQAWNGHGMLDWPSLIQDLPAQQRQAADWANTLRQHPDLATNLRDFCLARLKLG